MNAFKEIRMMLPDAFCTLEDRERIIWNAALDHAAKSAKDKAESVRAANTYRGKVNGYAVEAAHWIDAVAAAIEKEKV